MRTSLVVGVLALCMFGCRGKELATAQLAGTGSADVQFTSTGKPLVLWADTEGEWHNANHFPAHYEIDVSAGSTKLGHITCDTRDSSESVCGVKVSEGNTHHGDCELKLSCAVPAIPAGPASLHVVGTAGAGTSNIKKMSINIRSK